MANYFKGIIATVALQALIGCAATGSIYSAQENLTDDKARIIFYRPKEFTGSGVNLVITEDGEEILKVQNGQFVPHIVDPGTKVYSIKTIGNNNELKLDIEPYETYYVRLAIRHGAFVNTLYLSRVYVTEALEELSICCKSGDK